MAKQIRVFLADSQSVFRAGLANILGAEADITVIGEASDSSQAIEKVLKLEPNVILMDISMSNIDGLQTLEAIKKSNPNMKVLIITESAQEDNVFQALASGADGYLLKSCPSEQLVDAVRRVANGEVILSTHVTSQLVAELREKTAEPRLSAREVEVLNLLSDGLTNVETAQRLLVSESTVRTYIYRILEKLNLKNRTEAVAYATRRHLSFARIAERLKALDIQSTIGSQDIQISAPDEASLVTEKESDVSAAVESARKPVTALYVELDIRSTKSEQLASDKAEELIHECLDFVTEEIQRYEGIVAWFTGNGIMAFFGVPSSNELTPQRALYSALAIQSHLKDHNEQLRDRGIQLDMHMGVNSGYATMEKARDKQTSRYIPLGDTTKLVAKMVETAEPDTIMVAESTHRLTKDYFDYEPLTAKKEPAGKYIYRLLGPGPARSKLEAAMARGLTRFVGRERELDNLVDCFNRATKGRGQVVGILGEAGVGKSRLLLEFRHRLSEKDYSYLEGSCLYHGDSTPYLPILRILRSYFGILEGEKGSSIKRTMGKRIAKIDSRLKDTLTPLYELLSLSVDDESYLNLEPHERRQKVFDAIKHLLIRENQDRPVVLAVEDLHWIDRTSEEFLTSLIEGIANTRILLILLYRPEYSNPWGSKSYYTQIGLDQLSREWACEIIRATLEGSDTETALTDFIMSKAGGNPLFLEEMVNYLVETGSIEKRDNKYVLAINTSYIKAPDTVQEVIADRVDRLDADVKHTIQIASVIGHVFSPIILKSISGAKKDVSTMLRVLQGSEFIYEKSRFPESEYAFKHALTQDVVYYTISFKERQELHEKAGAALEALYSERLEEIYEVLGYHYFKSKNVENAVKYLTLAGDKVSKQYSNWEAFGLYKDAITTLNQLPETDITRRKGIEIRLSIADQMRLLAYPEGSLEILHEGEEFSQKLGDWTSLATFHSNIGLCHAFKGNPQQNREYTKKAFFEATESRDINLLAPIAFDLCSSYVIAGEYCEVIEIATTALTLIQEEGKEHVSFSGPHNFNLYSALSAYYGLSMGFVGNFEEGEIWCKKALDIACETANFYSMAFAEIIFSELFIFKGDGRLISTHINRAKGYSEEAEIVPILSLSSIHLGWAHYFLGELETALCHLEQGIQHMHETKLSIDECAYHACLAMIYLDLDDLEQAQSHAQEALKQALTAKEKRIEGISWVLQGIIMGRRYLQQTEQAEQSILQGIELLTRIKARPYVAQGELALGDLYANTSQREEAVLHLTRAKTAFREMGMEYHLNRTQHILDRLT